MFTEIVQWCYHSEGYSVANNTAAVCYNFASKKSAVLQTKILHYLLMTSLQCCKLKHYCSQCGVLNQKATVLYVRRLHTVWLGETLRF